MTDFVHDPARAADASHDGDCPDCPMAPNALVSVQGGPGALARRTFLTRTMLGAAALALAACGVSDGTTAPFSGTASVNINDYPALANVGGVALVTLNGSLLALVRNSTTSVLALSRVCPHQGGTINTGGAGSSARVTGRSSTSRGSGWVASRRRTCGRTRRRSTPVPGRS